MRHAFLTVAAVISLPALALISFRQTPAEPAAAPRYLYVVGCGATIDKIDTVTERKLAQFDLSAKTDQIPNPKGHLDGCLANGVAYDPAQRSFYTAVPVSAHFDEQDSRHYRILRFSLPAMLFLNAMALEPDLSDPPQLRVSAEGSIYVRAGDKDFQLVQAVLRPVSAKTPLFSSDLNVMAYKGSDLSSFRLREGSTESVPAEVLEISGNAALVQLSSARDDEVFAVANAKTMQIAVLHDLPPTFPQNVHLAPDGQAVLVEAARPPENGSEIIHKTGELALFDGASGKRLKQWTMPNLDGNDFLAFTPNGKIVYHSGSIYRFTSSNGTSHPDVPVYRNENPGPPLFFASE
jgi:hypothetical protein